MSTLMGGAHGVRGDVGGGLPEPGDESPLPTLTQAPAFPGPYLRGLLCVQDVAAYWGLRGAESHFLFLPFFFLARFRFLLPASLTFLPLPFLSPSILFPSSPPLPPPSLTLLPHLPPFPYPLPSPPSLSLLPPFRNGQVTQVLVTRDPSSGKNTQGRSRNN